MLLFMTNRKLLVLLKADQPRRRYRDQQGSVVAFRWILYQVLQGQ
jgi:hypothetical protein